VGSAGATRVIWDFGLRAAPSAGALCPVETYLVVHSVEGIEPGVYHYAVETHELDQLQVGDFRAGGARAALDATVLCYQSSS
jgi:SagB-type dehydrogenase family enzyme